MRREETILGFFVFGLIVLLVLAVVYDDGKPSNYNVRYVPVWNGKTFQMIPIFTPKPKPQTNSVKNP